MTVGILAAVYFFIVKPTLDTTNNAINRGFDVANQSLNDLPSQQELQNQIKQSVNQTQLPPDRTQRLVAQLRREVHRIQKTGNTHKIERMAHCLQVSGPNLQRAVICVRKIP